MAMYCLDSLGIISCLCIFHVVSSEGVHSVNPKYQPLRCKRCGRFDESEAIKMGIGNGKLYLTNKDINYTDDGFLVVSEKFRQQMGAHIQGEVDLIPVGEEGDLFLVWAKSILRAPADSRYYKPLEPASPGDLFQVRSRPCRKCGRFNDVTVNVEALVSRDDQKIIAVAAEHSGLMHPCFVINDELRAMIVSAGIRGALMNPI